MSEVKLQLTLREGPFAMELRSEEGTLAHIDASPAIGGQGKGMRPMELLAGSLAGCMSIDILNILKKQRVQVSHFEVAIKGNRAEAVPSKYSEINLEFIANSAVPLDKLENAIHLSHTKYCSVSASLNPDIKVTTTARHQ